MSAAAADFFSTHLISSLALRLFIHPLFCLGPLLRLSWSGLVLPPPSETALRYWLLRLEQINYKQLLGVEKCGLSPRKKKRTTRPPDARTGEGLWAANH